jgi:hypothetical protein
LDNREYYEEQEYEAYEDDNNHIWYTIGINILLVLLIVEVLFLSIGMINTDFTNNNPQVMNIKMRKEKEYIKKVNKKLDTIQKIYMDIENLYQVFVENQSTGVEKADNTLTSHIITLTEMRDELKYLNTPDRFESFNGMLLETISTFINMNNSLLQYFRTFNEGNIQEFNQYHGRYNTQMQSITNMWQKLLDKSSQTGSFQLN